MKLILSILIAAILCATASAQTIRTLGYNSTNGQVVAATNMVWTNSFSFSSNAVAAQVRTNLLLSADWLTNTNVSTFRSDIGLPLSALTNTSNATAMRALSGSTNASHPFSGSFVFVDDAANTWSATVSNGIIQSVVEQ